MSTTAPDPQDLLTAAACNIAATYPSPMIFYGTGETPEALIIPDTTAARPEFYGVTIDGGEIGTHHTDDKGQWVGGLPGNPYPFAVETDEDHQITGFTFNRR